MSIDKVGSSSQYETASKGVAKKNIAVGLTVGSGIVGGGALGYLGVDKFVKLVQKEAIPSKNLKIFSKKCILGRFCEHWSRGY